MVTVNDFASTTAGDFDALLRVRQQILQQKSQEVQRASDRAMQAILQAGAIKAKNESDIRNLKFQAAQSGLETTGGSQGFGIGPLSFGGSPLQFQPGADLRERRKQQVLQGRLNNVLVQNQVRQEAIKRQADVDFAALQDLQSTAGPGIGDLDTFIAGLGPTDDVSAPDRRAGLRERAFDEKENQARLDTILATAKRAEAAAKEDEARAQRLIATPALTRESFIDRVQEAVGFLDPTFFQSDPASEQFVENIAGDAFDRDQADPTKLDPLEVADVLIQRKIQGTVLSQGSQAEIDKLATPIANPETGEITAPAPVESQIFATLSSQLPKGESLTDLRDAVSKSPSRATKAIRTLIGGKDAKQESEILQAAAKVIGPYIDEILRRRGMEFSGNKGAMTVSFTQETIDRITGGRDPSSFDKSSVVGRTLAGMKRFEGEITGLLNLIEYEPVFGR